MDLPQRTSRIYLVSVVRNTLYNLRDLRRLNLSCLCRAQIMASMHFVIAEHCYRVLWNSLPISLRKSNSLGYKILEISKGNRMNARAIRDHYEHE